MKAAVTDSYSLNANYFEKSIIIHNACFSYFENAFVLIIIVFTPIPSSKTRSLYRFTCDVVAALQPTLLAWRSCGATVPPRGRATAGPTSSWATSSSASRACTSKEAGESPHWWCDMYFRRKWRNGEYRNCVGKCGNTTLNPKCLMNLQTFCVISCIHDDEYRK